VAVITSVIAITAVIIERYCNQNKEARQKRAFFNRHYEERKRRSNPAAVCIRMRKQSSPPPLLQGASIQGIKAIHDRKTYRERSPLPTRVAGR
jgi:hypothetical protein